MTTTVRAALVAPLLMLTVYGCNWQPATYMDYCETSKDCAGDLTCQQVADLGYIALGDTAATMEVCTMACSADGDCPKSRECSDGNGGRAQDECVDGYCTAANCI